MSDPVVLLSTGDVVGPAGGVTDNSMVLFSGTSGKLIKGNNAVVTAQGLALLDDLDAAANRATIGLAQVNNTSDINKPVSTAQQAALNLKLDKTGGTLSGTLSGTVAQFTGMEVRAPVGKAYIDFSNDAVADFGARISLDSDDVLTVYGVGADGFQVNGQKVWNAGNFDPASKQANLGFSPVQQGTGVGQIGNTIKIGWSGTQVKVTVDSSDMGSIAFLGASPTFTNGITVDAGATINNGATISGTATFQNSLNVNGTSTLNGQTYAGALYSAGIKVGGSGYPPSTNGAYMAWNDAAGYSGGTMFTNNQGGGSGGFVFRNVNNANTVETGRVSFSSSGAIACSGVSSAGDLSSSTNIIASGLVFSGGANGGRLAADGNIFGTQWGNDWLSNFLGQKLFTYNLGSATANLGLSGVGTYAFARLINSAGPINQGTLVAGSSLLYSSTEGSDGAGGNSGLINVGTWRLHGAISTTNRSLWMRIS